MQTRRGNKNDNFVSSHCYTHTVSEYYLLLKHKQIIPRVSTISIVTK